MLSTLYQGINQRQSQKEIRAFFDSVVRANSYKPRSVKLTDNSPAVPESYVNTPSAGDRLIRAAYKDGAKVGTLVGRPIRDKNTYVIGMVYSTRSKGSPSFEEVEDEIRKNYIRDMKAKMIVKEFEGKSIQDLVKEQNLQVQSPSVTLKSLNNIDANVGGALFAEKNNKENVSLEAMTGEKGVYKIFIKSANVPVEKKSLKVEKEQMNKQLIAKMVKSPINYNQNRKPSEESFLINGLYKKANIIDNRKLLQLNVRN